MASSTPESVADPAAAGALPGARPAAVPGRRILRQLWRRQTAALGLGLAAAVLLGALLAPWLAPADPVAMTPVRFAAPSADAWLGTDQFGRDLLSRLLHGARVSMAVSFAAVGLAALIGGTIGLCAGYFEGRV